MGHYYFHAVEEIAGLNFPVYVAVLQAFHLLNVWLLWLVARRLGAPPFAAAAACLFFGLHMALFDDFWKPMYIFDVLCATFCLLSLWCYASERWVLSFAAFWLAYKSKELAVMLPAVLLVFEIWFGKRRWKPLVPFFLTSLSFGVQGMLRNPNHDNDYTFRFTAAALSKTSVFYAGRIFLIPYLGFVTPAFALAGAQSPHLVRTGGDGTVSLPDAVSARARLQRVLLPAVRGSGDRHHGAGGRGVARRGLDCSWHCGCPWIFTNCACDGAKPWPTTTRCARG